MKVRLFFSIALLFNSAFSQIDCITLQPGSQDGYDAEIWDLEAATNYGDWTEIKANAWTWDGDHGLQRALFKFQLEDIPAGAILDSAKLFLYAVDSPSTQLHYGDNGIIIQRITEDWGEATVTWDSQPATTNENEMLLPASITAYQDYTDIDVLDLVTDMIAENNYGFMLMLQTEETLRRMTFSSSDDVNEDNHPKLVVCYHLETSIHQEQINDLTITPQPVNSIMEIICPNEFINREIKISIYDLSGREILTRELISTDIMQIELNDLPDQPYMIALHCDGNIYRKLIIKQ